jgi:hypothetical protein
VPVKRRTGKRRLSTEAEVDAWSEAFSAGCDFLGTLAAIGIEIKATRVWRDPQYPAMEHSNYDDVFRAEAKRAWRKLGAAFLAKHGRLNDQGVAWWALDQFGDPPA